MSCVTKAHNKPLFGTGTLFSKRCETHLNRGQVSVSQKVR